MAHKTKVSCYTLLGAVCRGTVRTIRTVPYMESTFASDAIDPSNIPANAAHQAGKSRRGGPTKRDSFRGRDKWSPAVLGSRRERPRVEVHGIGRAPVKGSMRTSGVEEGDVASDAGSSLGDGFIGMQVDLLVLHRSPQPLNEDVVAPGAAAIHADADLMTLENADEVGGRELRALVGVEDLRLSEALQRLLECLDAEVGGLAIAGRRNAETLLERCAERCRALVAHRVGDLTDALPLCH